MGYDGSIFALKAKRSLWIDRMRNVLEPLRAHMPGAATIILETHPRILRDEPGLIKFPNDEVVLIATLVTHYWSSGKGGEDEKRRAGWGAEIAAFALAHPDDDFVILSFEDGFDLEEKLGEFETWRPA